MRVLVTGSAGFIGYHLTTTLIDEGHSVLGIDPLTDYYDVSLKRARLSRLETRNGYSHRAIRLESATEVNQAFAEFQPEAVVHLAAQAGVRYALEEPRTYVDSNIVGTFNVLEGARTSQPLHLLMASTSSVYGSNSEFPYSETQRTDHPMSFYAATKKATEDMAHSYSHLHEIPTTMFRFFTVYGSWGRPDMAIFKFTQAALNGTPIQLHDGGSMRRDFTHVSDLVSAVMQLISAAPEAGQPVGGHDSLSPVAPFRTVNIGGGAPISVIRFIEAIEKATGREIARVNVPAVPGEVPVTDADPALLRTLTGYTPRVLVDDGVQEFVDWYRSYYA